MKKLSIYIFGWMILFSLGAQALNLRGFVFISDGQYYYTDVETRKSYLVHPANRDAETALYRLKSFDTLMGSGTPGPNNLLFLDTVDFVSLRRLIGIWKGPQTVVNFVDYNRVSFHLQTEQKMSEYNYALAPAEGDRWQIFFTDQSSVALGSLTVENSKAQIEVYDLATGEISQRYNLEKLNP